jgi:hypothetical protein
MHQALKGRDNPDDHPAAPRRFRPYRASWINWRTFPRAARRRRRRSALGYHIAAFQAELIRVVASTSAILSDCSPQRKQGPAPISSDCSPVAAATKPPVKLGSRAPTRSVGRNALVICEAREGVFEGNIILASSPPFTATRINVTSPARCATNLPAPKFPNRATDAPAAGPLQTGP